MEQKTKVSAEDGRHDLFITREFNLPVELLFRAYAEADIVEQWMGTKVLRLDSVKDGSYQFETSDGKGNILFKANGVIHDFVRNHKIVRTFEMESAPFDVQLEFIKFESLDGNTSKLTIHTIFRSAELRDQLLKMPFEYGINMAHNRLEEIFS